MLILSEPLRLRHLPYPRYRTAEEDIAWLPIHQPLNHKPSPAMYSAAGEIANRKGCRSKSPPSRFMPLAHLSRRLEIVADANTDDFAFAIAVFPVGPDFEQPQIERRADRQPPNVQPQPEPPTQRRLVVLVHIMGNSR